MKKFCAAVLLAAGVALLTGIHALSQGIALSGPAGVHYGRVLIPLLVGLGALWLLKKSERLP